MSFYPPGWTDDRLPNASGDDLLQLSDSQRTTLFDGLRATHGEDGFRAIMRETSRRYRARVEASKSDDTNQQECELNAPFIKSCTPSSEAQRLRTGVNGGSWCFAQRHTEVSMRRSGRSFERGRMEQMEISLR